MLSVIRLRMFPVIRRRMLSAIRRRMLPMIVMLPAIMPSVTIRIGRHVGVRVADHGPVLVVPRKSLERNFVGRAQERLPQAVIPRQVRPLDVPPDGRARPRLEPRRPLPGAVVVPVALLHRRLFPQRLARLFSSLFVPHVVPELGPVVLLQKSPGGIQRPPIVDDFHRHQRFVQPFGRQVLSLPILDNLAIALIPRVVISPSPPAEEAVVLPRLGDALQGPRSAARQAGLRGFIVSRRGRRRRRCLDVDRFVRVGRGRHGRVPILRPRIIIPLFFLYRNGRHRIALTIFVRVLLGPLASAPRRRRRIRIFGFGVKRPQLGLLFPLAPRHARGGSREEGDVGRPSGLGRGESADAGAVVVDSCGV
mmetsp:Transcript_1959/g.4281  ORF Transcript_1959/g.4281 Transcript_1959/m.4281 type:complete len:364 (-) Transcript_1959:172-1263(-)